MTVSKRPWPSVGIFLLALTLCLGAAPGPSLASPEQAKLQLGEIERLRAEKEAALARGDFAAAETLLRQMLIIVEAVAGTQSFQEGQIRTDLGFALWNQGQLEEAAQSFRVGLQIYRAAKAAPDDIEHAAFSLGSILSDRGEYPEAERLMREAVDSRLARLGPDNPDTATRIGRLSLTVLRSGRFEEAEQYAAQAVTILRGSPTPDIRMIASALTDLSAAQRMGGHLMESEASIREALAQYSSAGAGAGVEQDIDVAAALGALGAVLHAQGRYSEAEQALRQSLEIYQDVRGDDHPDLAFPLIGLGAVLHDRGRLLAPSRRGDWNAEQANLPESSEALSNYADAELFYRRALFLYQRAYGSENPYVGDVMSNIANVLEDRGELQAAEEMQRQALSVHLAALGPGHPSVAGTLYNLGTVVRRRGDAAAAEVLFRQALEIQRQAFAGPQHLIGSTLFNLGVAVLAQGGRKAEARVLFDQAYHMKLDVWCPAEVQGARSNANRADCPGHPDLAGSMAGNGAVYFAFEDRPWAGVRMVSQAEDMVLHRTRSRYTLDADARTEFREHVFVHRQFVSTAWAAGTPGDTSAIASAFRSEMFPGLPR